MSRLDALYAELGSRAVLFDGATGSYTAALFGELGAYERDRLAILDPGKVLRVHRDYLAAGARVVKTATFNANALALAAGRPEALVPAEEAYELNAAAAGLARAAAAEAESRDGLVRWVAGSIGPGSAAPSLGGPGYRELVASYLPQARGLVQGGADLALIETVQDPVQAKAAIEAWKLACDGAGQALPFVVSATVDAVGRLLSGASPAAFAAAVEPFGPLAVGLNCSGGPEELKGAYAVLAAFSSSRLALMPNAGLPRRGADGGLRWPLRPEAYADASAAAWGGAMPSFVGGCCGTEPGHIEALARILADGVVGRGPRRRSFALASAFEAKPLRPGRSFLIDERSNAQGSAAFKRLVADGDREAALRFVLGRASSGADGVDLNVAGPRERAWLPALAAAAAPLAAAALSLDSVDPEALEAALPGLAGRPLVNSVNLENEERAERLLRLAARHGAAVVCLALDAEGPARDAKAKVKVARRLYELALKAGLEPADLLFDLCTFPAAAGGSASAGSAYETFAALASLGEACPGAGSVLGVGNSSFGLPKAMRPRFTAAFLEKALEAGLAAAIVDPAAAKLLGPEGRAADEEQRRFARLSEPFFRPGEPSAGELDALLARTEPDSEAGGGAAAADGRDEGDTSSSSGPASAAEALGAAIAERDAPAALAALEAALGDGVEPSELARRIAGAMAALGKRYDDGKLPLPLVLRSADVARVGFDALRRAAALGTASAAGTAGEARRLVLLSTVKGDLHDIGKNLVAMVLEAGGYEVADLGIDRGAEEIAAAAIERGAFAVGVSGLLTRSLVEMEAVAEALARRGSDAALLCGGAAVDRAFVSERLEPLRPGLVRYGKDPFEALEILGGLAAPERTDPPRLSAASLPRRSGVEAGEPPSAAGSLRPGEGASRPGSVATPPAAATSAGYLRFELGELAPLLDRPTIIDARLRFRRADRARGERLLDEALSFAAAAAANEGYEPGAEASYAWFAVRAAPGDAIELYPSGAADSGAGDRGAAAEAPGAAVAPPRQAVSFAFPRESGGQRRSLYDYYSTLSEAPAFCVTLGAWAEAALRRAKEAGDGGLYLATHAALAGLAEAAAELMHRRLADEAAARGMEAPGKRYSLGYPACPGVERNAELLAALGSGRIGLRAAESGQLMPEFSVSALVVPSNQAEYFDPRPKTGRAAASGREGGRDA